MPTAVRIRTRLRVNTDEAASLAEVGDFLGAVYRAELSSRVRLGHLTRSRHAGWRAERKRELTKISSSRWGGAITRCAEDQYQLGLRGLAAHAVSLRASIDVLEKRCALAPGERSTHGDRGTRPLRGYRNDGERFQKSRRLIALRDRLDVVEQSLAKGRPTIAVGGRRLWRSRNNLLAADMTEPQWRDRWDAARMFLTADGESGKRGGNETIRVDPETHQLRIRVPAGLSATLGSHLTVTVPVSFRYLGLQWQERISSASAVRYDVEYDPQRDRWYLHASWKSTPQATPTLSELRSGRMVGVDLNADHLALCVVDPAGNPVGQPCSIPMALEKRSASHRDSRIRAAITRLLDHAELQGCGAIAIENLDFADARSQGRETLGRGSRGKRFRRTVSGIPTSQFRRRLVTMAARRGIAVVGVDPAYTSKWGNQHWRKPLQQQTSDVVTQHRAAAAAIGRRGLGLKLKRRPAGPRNGQRTNANHLPAWLDLQRVSTSRRSGSDPPVYPSRCCGSSESTRRQRPRPFGPHGIAQFEERLGEGFINTGPCPGLPIHSV
jgi:IS605 OrfB family transposase